MYDTNGELVHRSVIRCPACGTWHHVSESWLNCELVSSLSDYECKNCGLTFQFKAVRVTMAVSPPLDMDVKESKDE